MSLTSEIITTPLINVVLMKDILIDRLKTRFLSILTPCNENISDDEYENFILPGSLCNLKWDRRILLESFEDYNIMMKYDINRHSFVYYCDRSFVPYDILNAIAMKFVITFRCSDYSRKYFS